MKNMCYNEAKDMMVWTPAQPSTAYAGVLVTDSKEPT